MNVGFKRGLLTFILIVIVGAFFQNCSPIGTLSDGFNSYLSINTERIDDQCQSNLNVKACVFLKSPIALRGHAIVDEADIDSFAIYSVGDEGFFDGQSLRNSRVQVTSAIYENAMNGNFKYKYSDGDKSKLGQVNTFYWANYFIKFWSNNFPEDFSLKSQMVYIVTDSRISGWSYVYQIQ